MKTILTLLVATLAVCLSGPAHAAEISLESAPPVVVKTVPVAGATDVDPGLTEIKVTFSKAMQDGSWSWSTWGRENFPETVGSPKYLADGRTCVLTVKLQPDKFYATWLNSDKFHNFKDASGRPAVPYLLTFRTAAAGNAVSASSSEIIDRAVRTISQCTETDPRVAKMLEELHSVPEAQVVAGLIPYLDSKVNTIRRSAVYVLWRGGFDNITPARARLQKLLSHSEDITRGMAALALGQNHIREDYPALAKMLKDDTSGYARRCAAYALGAMGDLRAVPDLKAALNDPEPAVRHNAEAALRMLETAKPADGAKDEFTISERNVNKQISAFPEAADLSTPESACAAWQRASARKDGQAISQMSLVPLDAKEQEAWYQREEKRDPDGLAIYLKALADSKVVAVQVYRGELANVITYLPFPQGKGHSPYSARCFGLVNGEWKNLGEDRLPDLESAKANFERKKGNLWRQFTQLKGKTGSASNRASASADKDFASKLNDDQRAFVAWTDRQFRGFFDARTFGGWSEKDRTDLEARMIDALKGPQNREYYQAINTLGALHSTKGIQPLLAIATDRADKDCRDRWMAIRVLGMIGDRKLVPDLIPLVYHGNVNTRWWAQISLVRLTGQNFGSDWKAWGDWWNKQGGQPAYDPEIIRWWIGQAEPDKLAESLAERDRAFLDKLKQSGSD